VIDGTSPAIAAAIPMIPYALALFQIAPSWSAFPVSMVSIFATLFVLGAFLGKISRENVMAAGLRMLAVGVITGVIVWALGSLRIG
jgi:predicted membrane protein (TIGR00267 family)